MVALVLIYVYEFQLGQNSIKYPKKDSFRNAWLGMSCMLTNIT
ncbi:MAG: hypothetical protein TECD_00967 [Hyphomicrobiaceae bacterium hypho_1]